MISVVGAGPAGCLAAQAAAKECDVRLYEQRPNPRVQCAGLISVSGMERLGLKPAGVVNEVSSAIIHPPSSSPFRICGGKKKAYVVDRRVFDEALLDKAVDAGAALIREQISNISKLSRERLVLATGTDYGLHKRLGLQAPKKFLIGAQYVMKLECDPDAVELHFNVPGFFSWVIPAGDGLARVGCCSYQNPSPFLDSFARKLSSKARILEKNHGIIPVHEPALRTQYPNVVLVGDAAGQVKASTGGGIVVGGLAAKYAHLPDYEKRWRSELALELRMHLWIHSFLSRLSDEKKDTFFSLIASRSSILEEKGDMDRASSVFSLLKDPVFAARFFFSFFPDLF